MRGVRWTIYIAAGIVIASSVLSILWPMLWGLLCDPGNTFVRCEPGFAFRWHWLLMAVPVPFAVYAIVAVRRSGRVADAWVSGVLLLTLGLITWLLASLLSAAAGIGSP
ncbi:hypothetical protein PV458_29760 [Streptomyces sp. MN03-5084-2B]|nr:hypothetical protein [Streptomyces sp. MN03-5084-2B]